MIGRTEDGGGGRLGHSSWRVLEWSTLELRRSHPIHEENGATEPLRVATTVNILTNSA